jgi:hypothetical protein
MKRRGKGFELDIDLNRTSLILMDITIFIIIGNLNVITLYGKALDGGGLTNVEGQKHYRLYKW